MTFKMHSLFTLLPLLCLTPANAVQEPKGHHLMMMVYTPVNKIIEMDTEGKVVWEHKVQSLAVMFEVRKNGNVIYAYGGNPTGVQEVDKNHKIVWDYKAECEQVLGFSTLPNGNILVGEQGPCRAVEVNPKGEVVKTTPLTTDEKPAHRQLRNIHKLKDGHLLACHEADATVREYDETGKVVWQFGPVTNVFEAIRLKNGNTLIGAGTQARIIEVEPSGKIVWEFSNKDAPELNITWITGIQIRKNGNLVVADFHRGNETKAMHFFEVTRKKQVVNKNNDYDLATLVTMVKYLDD